MYSLSIWFMFVHAGFGWISLRFPGFAWVLGIAPNSRQALGMEGRDCQHWIARSEAIPSDIRPDMIGPFLAGLKPVRIGWEGQRGLGQERQEGVLRESGAQGRLALEKP